MMISSLVTLINVNYIKNFLLCGVLPPGESLDSNVAPTAPSHPSLSLGWMSN